MTGLDQSQSKNKKTIEKIYAYQADEMKAIWKLYHKPDVDEFEVSPGDVK